MNLMKESTARLSDRTVRRSQGEAAFDSGQSCTIDQVSQSRSSLSFLNEDTRAAGSGLDQRELLQDREEGVRFFGRKTLQFDVVRKIRVVQMKRETIPGKKHQKF